MDIMSHGPDLAGNLFRSQGVWKEKNPKVSVAREKNEQLGSMNDLSGPIGYSAALFMKAVGQKARAKEFKFYNLNPYKK